MDIGGGGGGGSLRNRTIFWGAGAFLNILGFIGLFKVKIQNEIFLDSKISNIFGCA